MPGRDYVIDMLIMVTIGVMRFLQMEWHRHERDRNAWQIERAEMKSRIGKLEGDGRTSKRLQESLGKHVKILENALRREREKARSAPLDEPGGGKDIGNQGKTLVKVAPKSMFRVRIRSYGLTICSSGVEPSRFVPGRRARRGGSNRLQARYRTR
jgi:hypothetical protein